MKCVLIFGPPAVGKMAVGMEIAAQKNFKLVYNHSFNSFRFLMDSSYRVYHY